jgi:hypothetical protein
MRDAGPRAPNESDPPRSDPTSGIRRTPSLGSDAVKPSEVETLPGPVADPTSDGEQGLPNWSDREADERPGWAKAGLPREEWLRAKANNDARIAKAAPGSEEFSRLMEARLRMHLGPPPAIDFREISEFKKSVYREHLQGDLEAEIRQKEGPNRTLPRFVVAIALLLIVVGLLALILLRGAGEAQVIELTAVPPKAELPVPPEAPVGEAVPTVIAGPQGEPTVKLEAPATVVLTVKPATPAKVEAPAKPEPRPTATTPPPKPTATGETPFFR